MIPGGLPVFSCPQGSAARMLKYLVSKGGDRLVAIPTTC